MAVINNLSIIETHVKSKEIYQSYPKRDPSKQSIKAKKWMVWLVILTIFLFLTALKHSPLVDKQKLA
jgi:hypothetical protein